MYQLEDFSNSRALLMEDLIDLERKKTEAERVLNAANADYVSKRKLYKDAQDKFDDLLQYKQNVKEQMLGFI
jgi:uncharacterized coiled-coil protein SlyX